MTVADLLRGLLLESANDAAVTLAEEIGGSRAGFVRMMNRRARELDLVGTRYANPIGLDDPRNRSTARDLVRLTLELRRYAFFRRVVNRTRVTLASGDRPRTVQNRNTLLRRNAWMSGVKTGHTRQAGYVLVGSGRREPRGIELISVVLGAPSEAARNADTLALLEWGFDQFRRVTVLRRWEVRSGWHVPIRYRRGAELDLAAGRTVRRVVREGRDPGLSVHTPRLPAEVEGPLRRGQAVAVVEVREHGRRVATVPLVAANGVPDAGLVQRTKDWFTRPGALLLVAAALVASVLVARGWRRGIRRRRAPRGEPETA
jgi:D-alanyl-D-alanine carboxypeptidase (penicillin-binding protein 5/6)